VLDSKAGSMIPKDLWFVVSILAFVVVLTAALAFVVI
jgi:hypothetical protein